MPKLTLSPEDLRVETFSTDALVPAASRPRTDEPTCTDPEWCVFTSVC